MEKKRLSADIVSVIHHIKLNEVGWWESSLQRLILIVLWFENKALSIEEVQAFFLSELGLQLTSSNISEQLNVLITNGKVNVISGNKYSIGEETSEEIKYVSNKNEELTNSVKQKFLRQVQIIDEGINGDLLWDGLNNDLIIPSVKNMGSHLYQLFTGENPNVLQMSEFNVFLDNFKSEDREKIKEIVVTFLSSNVEEIRIYILSFLRAYFILESGKLGDNTISSLYQSMKEDISFNIFADTNFLFSILGIHNNPSDEEAESLLTLITQLQDRIPIKLFVLPITLEETRKAIQWRVDRAADIKISKNLAYVARNQNDVSGFLQRLSEQVAKTGQALTVKEFYGPYVTNLLDIVRSKGVELYNCDLQALEKKEEVQSDIANQYDFETNHYGDSAKRYAAIEHDMILWHFINQKRNHLEDSPLDVNYWVVTVDFHLLRFDQYKRSGNGDEYPVTLHPSTLIQMLQFWVPRSTEFEEIIYRSWLSPLLLEDFGTNSEEITLKIIKVLSRYENIDDLPPEVVRNIFLDEAIRRRLSEGVDQTDEEISQFIDETIIRETKRLATEVELQKKESEKKDKYIENQSKDLAESRSLISDKETEIKSLKQKLKDREEDLSNTRSKLEEITVQKGKNKFLFIWLYLPIIFSIICLIVSIILVSRLTPYNIPVLMTTIWLLVYILISSIITKTKLSLSAYDLSVLIQKYKTVRNWLFGALLLSIFIELIASCGVNEYQSIVELLK